MSLSSSTTAMRAMAPPAVPVRRLRQLKQIRRRLGNRLKHAAPEGRREGAALDRGVRSSANAARPPGGWNPARYGKGGNARGQRGARLSRDDLGRGGAVAALLALRRRLGLLASGGPRRPRRPSLILVVTGARSPGTSRGVAGRTDRHLRTAEGAAARRRPRRCPTGWWSSTGTTGSPSTTAAIRR